MKLTIGIDFTSAARERAGIGRYARELIRALARIDLDNRYILFVPRDVEYPPAELPRMGRLTVGETPEFLSSGGVVSFYLRDNQVRFEIDPGAARLAGVRINAHVLQLGALR